MLGELRQLPESDLFRISRTRSGGAIVSQGKPTQNDFDLISHYCGLEGWTADLDTGIFTIGPETRRQHGLAPDADCGLLTLIRCYRRQDRYRLLDLFEATCLDPASFCFSTVINRKDGSSGAVICIGESASFSDDGSGTIAGVFIYPRFPLEDKAPASAQ